MSETEPVVAEVLAEARRRWPSVSLSPATFTSYLRERAGGDTLSALADLQRLDLFLACACAQGDNAAIAAFNQEYLPGIQAALRSLRAPQSAIDDVVSRLLEELFTRRRDAPPRIGQYAGRSSLRAWLQVVATRMALRLLQREKRYDLSDSADRETLDAPLASPELMHLKVAYRDAFQAAFREAAAALSSRERNLLRYQYLDRLTGDEIAGLYGVHRATVVRWLGQASDALLDGTRQRLMTRMAIDRTEFDSITRFVHSQLDFGVRSLLASADE